MKRSTPQLLATVLAGLFGLFLTYGSLTSSDFPCGLYGPPISAKWDSIALLGANRIWNYNFNHETSLQNYLDNAYDRGMKAVLTLDPAIYDTFYLQFYSTAQHHIYEAEQHYDTALWKMEHEDPLGFYFFNHSSTWNGTVRGQLVENPEPENGFYSWKCTQGASYGPGIMLKGPNETLEGEDDDGTHGNQDRAPDTTSAYGDFKAIIRVMANLDSLSAMSDPVFYWIIRKAGDGNAMTLDSAYYTGASFGGVSSPNWKEFELEYNIPDGAFYVDYQVYWLDNCDFWVDWVEFYDMLRGRLIFEKDANGAYVYRAATLTKIADQCQEIENDQSMVNKIAAWKQPDEPLRCMYDAVGVINLMARDSLILPIQMAYSQLQLHCWYTQRPELFALMGRPAAIDPDIYTFADTVAAVNYLGSQQELDSLSDRLERNYQAAADSGWDLHFTGQVHSWWDYDIQDWVLRDPQRSEILAETYMALAHGATEITFYKYTSGPPYLGGTSADSGWGLVNTFGYNPTYSHAPSEPHLLDEKWQAVHDVFAQLDAIGDTLLRLEREAAYCCSLPNYQDPIQSIYFEDDDTDYIEVGQFHDSADISQKYLIIVNRRTDGDRHISVETDKTGTWALRDLYTQEQFISSTGDFKAIPFDAGEGRVLKLVSL